MRLAPTSPLLTMLHHTLATPWAFPNTTSTSSAPETFDATNTTLSSPSGGPYNCTYVYPSDLTVVNSRYPDYSIDHLHQAHRFFMLRRQTRDQGEVATRVQFTNLPPVSANKTCRLEFLLPTDGLQRISGPNPTFNIYRVERGADTIATWETYVGNTEGVDVFGQANGEKEARERIRSVGGMAAVNESPCEETMTFQMGMAFDSLEVPNYWEFSNVAPPAGPVQGFRVVWGC